MPAAGRVSDMHSSVVSTHPPPRPDQRRKEKTDFLIIGAGPAGLSIGFELQQRGMTFLILERGGTVGESWNRMPRYLKLVSPWKSNSLPGTAEKIFPRHYQISRGEFLDYLQGYARKAALPVQTNCSVQAVERLPDGLFRVRTSQGDFFSRIVVNASGYFSNPFVPVIAGAAESHIRQLHVADYIDSQHIASVLGASPSPLNGERAGVRGENIPSRPANNSPLILIVGKRLSAGQIMVELAEHGFSIALSHRTPIEYGAEPWAWWFLFRIFPWLEWMKLKSKGARAPSNDVRMAGGAARNMITSGKAKTYPSIQRFDTDAVIFEDGHRLQPDLVLYATGFRPALGHLAPLDILISAETGRPRLRDMESVSVPGLYFIGLDHARNFQSRFIRGIRKDAAFLAERLEQAVPSANSEPLHFRP